MLQFIGGVNRRLHCVRYTRRYFNPFTFSPSHSILVNRSRFINLINLSIHHQACFGSCLFLGKYILIAVSQVMVMFSQLREVKLAGPLEYILRPGHVVNDLYSCKDGLCSQFLNEIINSSKAKNKDLTTISHP